MTNLTIQPQRVPLGSFSSPNGEVPVYITQPWFRALNQLINTPAPAPSPTPSGDVTIDPSPTFEFGDIVYSSTDTELKRLRSTEFGDVLYNQGPGVAPTWGPLPTPVPATVQLVLYALTGAALLTLTGQELQTL